MSTHEIALTIPFILFVLLFLADIVLSLVRARLEKKGRTGTDDTLRRIDDICLGGEIAATATLILTAFITGV